ncbi:hypothetical protein AcV5_002599 [Taiwanofungus camphoratus]|nr:hypothetical protein AcV5_002599 [Antrodia cinnamomea]
MPLFGRKNNKQAAGNAAAEGQYDNQAGTRTAVGAGPNVTDHGNTTGAGVLSGDFERNPTAGRRHPVNRHEVGRHGGARAAGAGPGDIPAQGYGNNQVNSADPYANENASGIPPASNVNQNGRRGGGGGRRLEGRAEQAVGSMVGSQALQAKGAQKEQEANAMKAQSAEIAEAERLEREAVLRRERAVAHGAHPDNKHLGGNRGANNMADPSVGNTGGVQTGTGGATRGGVY